MSDFITVAELRMEAERLCDENERLESENAQLRQQLADVTESMGRVEERCAKLRELVVESRLEEAEKRLKEASMQLKVTLTDGAPLPKHAKAGDAGLDLTTRQTVEIAPQGTVMVSTGVSIEIPEGYYGAVVPRSGMAYKRGLTIVNTPGTIDSSYRGIIMLPLYNAGHETIVVERGERVAQIIIKRHETVECVEVSELSETERGAEGFGSTGAR